MEASREEEYLLLNCLSCYKVRIEIGQPKILKMMRNLAQTGVKYVKRMRKRYKHLHWVFGWDPYCVLMIDSMTCLHPDSRGEMGSQKEMSSHFQYVKNVNCFYLYCRYYCFPTQEAKMMAQWAGKNMVTSLIGLREDQDSATHLLGNWKKQVWGRGIHKDPYQVYLREQVVVPGTAFAESIDSTWGFVRKPMLIPMSLGLVVHQEA